MARNGGLEAVANLVEEAWTAEATAFGEQKWNVLTLGMSLLVNLVEHNEANRYVARLFSLISNGS